jgi:hypothetical protein
MYPQHVKYKEIYKWTMKEWFGLVRFGKHPVRSTTINRPGCLRGKKSVLLSVYFISSELKIWGAILQFVRIILYSDS